MRALVTGAAGFLGSHIVDRCLEQGDEVRALVRPASDLSYLRRLPKVELAFGDLTGDDAVARATRGVDVVYHSAARVTDQGRRDDFYQANVLGTQRLLEAARRNGVQRFVFVSSPSVVTDQREQIDIDERYPYPARFINFYSETKALAEQLVLAASTRDFITCSIRPRAVWGPRDKTGFIPKVLAKMRQGRFPDISGGKKVYASLCHCQNAADACVLAARSDKVGGKAYFVTDAEKTEIWSFAARVGALFGLPPIRRRLHPVVANGVAALVDTVWALPPLHARWSPPLSRYAVGLLTLSSTYDISAAARDFGYRPIVDQESGLARLKAWVDEIGGLDALTRFLQ